MNLAPSLDKALCGLAALTLALGYLGPRPAHAIEPPTESQQVMAAVEKTLQRHAGDVHTCFAKALADRLDVAGKLELQVTVGAGRRVTEVSVERKADTVTDGLAACVADAAKGWQIDGIEPGASVVLPFTFSGQANQYVVRSQDAPLRGPQGRGKTQPPFAVKILVDAQNVRARHLAVTHLVVSPANRVAMHRHPNSAKVLYLLAGTARVLGPKGHAPVKLSKGDAVYVPKGFPHVIENMGRQQSAEMLQVFSPPGPEQVYRDPANANARAAFEVLRGSAVKAPEGTKLVVARGGSATAANGKVATKPIIDAALTGDPALSVNVIVYQPGAAVPKHANAGSDEFFWVVSGGGTLKVGAEDYAFSAGDAVHVPAEQPAASNFKKDEATTVVQVYAPGIAAKPESKP